MQIPVAEALIRIGGDAGDPVRGEFRLGPGNQEPTGYVIPLRQGKVSSDPRPGEFRVGPGNVLPPGVVVPL